MKLVIMSALILSTVVNADISKTEPAKELTLAAKIEKFKQENPHSLNILMGFLQNLGYYHTDAQQASVARFPNMDIQKGPGQEGPFIRLDTEMTTEHPQMLEGDKAPTTPNRLFQAIYKKNPSDPYYVKIDNCTRCAYFYSKALEIEKFRCTTYVPKEVFEELRNQKS